MTSQWDLPATKEWLKNCRDEQQMYQQLLGRNLYTKYKPSDYDNLKRNIGFAIYDKPIEDATHENEYLGYNSKQRKLINSIFNLLQECKKEHNDKDNIFVSFIFVHIKIEDYNIRTPVIRIPKTDNYRCGYDYIIDSTPRIYSSWQDYLDNNKLPDCLMCYPRNGCYSLGSEVQLDKCVSPEGQIGSKVLKGIAGVNAVTGAYSTGRSVAALRDRDVHRQSIGLDNAESRNCYLGIVGSVVGVVSGGATAALARSAQAGESIAMAGQIAMKGLAGTSCAINGLGVANGVANIVQKAINEEEVTSLDLFQLTSSILFFTSSVVSIHQAEQFMRNMKANPKEMSFLNQLRNFVDQTTRSATRVGEVTIWNGLASVSPVVTSPVVRETFHDICKSVFDIIFETSKLLWSKFIDLTQYRKEIGKYLRELWESWQLEIGMVVTKICELFGLEAYSSAVKSSFGFLAGKNTSTNVIFEFTKAVIDQRGQFQKVVENPQAKKKASQRRDPNFKGVVNENVKLPERVNEEIQVTEVFENSVLDISRQFAELQGCKSVEELIKYFKFVSKFVKQEFEKHRQNYEKTLAITRNFSPDVTLEDFDKKIGIPADKNNYFLNEALEHFKQKDGFFQLKLAYHVSKDLSEETHDDINRLDNGVAFRFFFNVLGRAEDGNLSKEQYFEAASQMIKQTVNAQNVSFIEDYGSAIMSFHYTDTIIIVKGHQQDGKVSGFIVMIDNN
ncbi:hypothetical protein C0J52_03384 [Blattella germanica]|nr:hypothetical protein C0J52_03384 [Blattella germanica]